MRSTAGWVLLGIALAGWAAPVWASQETGFIQSPGSVGVILPPAAVQSSARLSKEEGFRMEDTSGDDVLVPEQLQKYAVLFDNNSSDLRQKSGGDLDWQDAARNRIRVARLLSASA